MKNKATYIGLTVSILLLLVIIGFEIYINGRPENFDYCNGGEYPYSNWYYEYGDFDWQIVDWTGIFGSAKIYFELLLLLPWLVYYISKIRDKVNGVYKSIWLKILMWMSVIPIVGIFMHLIVHSGRFVIDYDTERDITARYFCNVFVFSLIAYYLNLIVWAVTNFVKVLVFLCRKREIEMIDYK